MFCFAHLRFKRFAPAVFTAPPTLTPRVRMKKNYSIIVYSILIIIFAFVNNIRKVE